VVFDSSELSVLKARILSTSSLLEKSLSNKACLEFSLLSGNLNHNLPNSTFAQVEAKAASVAFNVSAFVDSNNS
jgi:hypothetical protein